jgi:hypothetical protein
MLADIAREQPPGHIATLIDLEAAATMKAKPTRELLHVIALGGVLDEIADGTPRPLDTR